MGKMLLLKFLTPINLEEEKRKFLASKTYQPIFKYEWQGQQIEWLGRYKSGRYKDWIEAFLDQDLNKVVELGKKLFIVELTDKRIRQAREIISQTKLNKLKQPSFRKIKEEFEKVFSNLELNWQVKLGGSGFNFRPDHKRRILWVGNDMSLELMSLEGEIRHEVLHIIRYENGLFNQIKRSQDYLPTEEGLAAYFHDFGGKEENYSLYQHAAEYLATRVALKGSLREVVEFFLEIGFSKDLAWQRGVRHKFGFIDTRLSGDIMKPAMYFYHEMKVKEDLTDKDRLRLIMGKVDYDDLVTLGEYTGKISKESLMDFYNLENTSRSDLEG